MNVMNRQTSASLVFNNFSTRKASCIKRIIFKDLKSVSDWCFNKSVQYRRAKVKDSNEIQSENIKFCSSAKKKLRESFLIDLGKKFHVEQKK